MTLSQRLALVCLLIASVIQAQVSSIGIKKKKGTFYAAWGYNKDWFSNSDIHFVNASSAYDEFTKTNENYDFTLYALKAKDKSGFKHILNSPPTVPQYVYRIGYYFNGKSDLGIEINFDHAKYVMVTDQKAHLKGRINGVEYDKDTIVGVDFLKFEHTNGANFLMLNLLKRKDILKNALRKQRLGIVLKTGAGIVIPKTDVTLFGERLDNKFHVAGFIIGTDIGLRYEPCRHFFLESSFKGTFADYTNVLTVGNGKANHHFWTLEALLTGGISF